MADFLFCVYSVYCKRNAYSKKSSMQKPSFQGMKIIG